HALVFEFADQADEDFVGNVTERRTYAFDRGKPRHEHRCLPHDRIDQDLRVHSGSRERKEPFSISPERRTSCFLRLGRGGEFNPPPAAIMQRSGVKALRYRRRRDRRRMASCEWSTFWLAGAARGAG